MGRSQWATLLGRALKKWAAVKYRYRWRLMCKMPPTASLAPTLGFFFPYLCRATTSPISPASQPPPPHFTWLSLSTFGLHSLGFRLQSLSLHAATVKQNQFCVVHFASINTFPTGTNTELQIDLFVTLKKRKHNAYGWNHTLILVFNIFFFSLPCNFSPALLHFVRKHYAGKP